MAYVSFKRGSEADINKYLYTYTGNDAQSATEGTFYLTTDSHRLYIGQQVGTSGTYKAYPINQGVIVVPSIDQLPPGIEAIPGNFYYVAGSNILAIYSNGVWVQVNPASDDTYVNDRQFSVGTTSRNTVTNTNSATVVDALLLNNNTPAAVSNVTFTGTEGLDVSLVGRYTASTYFSPSLTYYRSDGNGGYTEVATGTITAQNYATQNSTSTLYICSGYTVALTPTVYQISQNTANDVATISISDSIHSSNIKLKAGSNIGLSYDSTADAIVVNNIDTGLSSIGIANAPNSGNGFVVAAQDYNGTVSSNWNPRIQVGDAVNEISTISFVDGVAILPVYTKTEVDKLKREFNAMQYKGVVLSESAMSSINTSGTVENGTVYMAGGSFQFTYRNAANNGQQTTTNINLGDLIIAQGDEVSTGYIPTADLKWQVIQSGSTGDTTVGYGGLTHGFTIGNNAGGTIYPLGNFKLAVNVITDANAGTTAVSANDNTNNQYLVIADEDTTIGVDNIPDKTVRITHKEYHATTTIPVQSTYTDASGNSTASVTDTDLIIPIPVFSYDKAGHITAAKIYNYKVRDTHATISHEMSALSTVNTSASIISAVTVDGTPELGTVNLTSNTLHFAVASGTNNTPDSIAINLEWGTF